MIERLLAAEDAFEKGELELAERLFGQVAEADARNAIAVVGLARIAERRGDRDAARAGLERALEIDPDEAAARRLLRELDAPAPPAAPAPAPVPAPEPAREITIAPMPARRPSLLARIRRWLGLGKRR